MVGQKHDSTSFHLSDNEIMGVGGLQKNLCLRCRRLSATERLANRSNSIASRALLCLKHFTYSAVFVKFVRCICPGSHFREWEHDVFFRLEF